MKRIILCADDYGQNSSVSQAIVELLTTKRLSATSCMVTTCHWLLAATKLQALKNQVDIGLHLNLTHGKPVSSALSSFFSLKTLLIQTTLRRLDIAAITTELRAQFDLFVDTMGQLPDFLDGHQHIHQFPVIRDIIFSLYQEKMAEKNHYIRCTYQPGSLFHFQDVAYLKQAIIRLCGGIIFYKEMIKRGIPHNSSFAGIYNFSASLEYAELFPRFLKQIKAGGILMCHPGLMENALTNHEEDEIINSRHNEYLYFSSNQFIQTCNASQVVLSRFKDLKSLAK